MNTTLNTPTASVVTDAHRDCFQRHGFFILENVLSSEQMQMLRDKVEERIKDADAKMDEMGVDKMGLCIKDSRYFAKGYTDDDKEVGDFIFSDLMYEIVKSTLGDNAYFFSEQYVVKAAEKGGKFSWHQDSGYVKSDHEPYLTCWVTLDDVNEKNGTVYLLPYERAEESRGRVEHVFDEESNDLNCYSGDDPGDPIICPAGSIAVFSSLAFHRSGPNQTDKMRRIYLPQYSVHPIYNPGTTEPWKWAEPFIVNGERVRFGADD